MPKKGKEKQVKSSEATGSSQKTEPLPQVWLPNQVEEEGSESGAIIATVGETDSAPLPTEEEQERMAIFWAMEEANAPKGWDEDKELDYSEMQVSHVEERDPLNESRSTGNPDLFSYAQTSVFTVKYLGHLKNVSSQQSRQAESQTETLVTIDTAQRQGRLPWVTSDSDERVLSLSKYGIKVMDVKKQRVFTRHPLHYIANITYYEDTYSKHMVALRQGKPDHDDRNELFIYECSDEAQAKDICLTLAQAFEAVFNKIKLEQNLRSSELR